MTPKEKAIELVDLFKIGDVVVEKGGTNQIVNINAYAKLFALRAVDEILKAVDNPDETYLMQHSVNYWTEVKEQIEKL
jgi:hypothetical protein